MHQGVRTATQHLCTRVLLPEAPLAALILRRYLGATTRAISPTSATLRASSCPSSTV